MDTIQFCSLCGEELIRHAEPYGDEPWESRVTLRCPNKRKRWFKPDKHTEVFTTTELTVLNYDPITGERIRRDRVK